MSLILAVLLLLCIPTYTFSKPKNKIFKNVRVFYNLQAGNIFASNAIAGNLGVSGNATIGGNLTVDGMIDGTINDPQLVRSSGASTINAVARFADLAH